MTFAYGLINRATGLVAAAFTVPVGAGPLTASRLYLNDGRMDVQYPFTAGTAVTIQIDLGSAQAVSAWAVLNHNFDSLGGGTCSITAADDVAWTTNIVTVKAASTFAAVAPRHKDSVFQFVSVSKRVWRLTFTNVNSGVVKIGEVFGVAATVQLSRGQIDGSGEKERMLVAEVEMPFGATKALFFAGPLRSKRFKVQDYTSAQRDELATLWRAVKGPTLRFLWIESYEATSLASAAAEQDCIFGHLKMPDFEWSWTNYNLTQPPELLIDQEGRERGA